MSTPAFDQVLDTVLFDLSTYAESEVENYWAGYYNFGADLSGTVSTTDVWQNKNGFYLFLKNKPDSWTVFLEEIQKLLPALNPNNQLRGLWLDNSETSYLSWNSIQMDAKATGSDATIIWTVLRSFSCVFGGYQLEVPGNNALTFIDDIDGGGFAFGGFGSLNGPAGGYVFHPGNLSFSGTGLGVISGTLTVPAAVGENSLWSSLKVGLQYAGAPSLQMVNIEEDVDVAATASKKYTGAIDLLYMPVFDGQSVALNPTVNFDPLNPTVGNRTAIGLFTQDGTAPGIFDSFMRTTRGYLVQLTPQPATGLFPSARLVFGRSPVNESMPGSYNYHLSPDGAYAINVVVPPVTIPSEMEERVALDENDTYQLLLGLSGLEYVVLGGVNDDTLVFEGGFPAYIPKPSSETGEDQNIAEALTDAATTSYLTVIPNSGTIGRAYYAQPKQAPIFSGAGGRADGLLNYNPMKAHDLSTGTSVKPPVFPSGVYAGVKGKLAELSQKLENASIAPFRHYCMGQSYGVRSIENFVSAPPQRRVREVDDPLGVTPQGLVAELTANYEEYDGLIIGNMPNTSYPKVALTAVHDMFKETLQSNQLFFVAANVNVLMHGTSVAYKMTEKDKAQLLILDPPVPDAVVTTVYVAIGNQEYETEELFEIAVNTNGGTGYTEQFNEVCGVMKVEMDGWTFQLSPRSWRSPTKFPDDPTLMIAKFCNGSLEDLVADTTSWLWPEVATPADGKIGYTQRVIQNIIDAAKKVDATEDYKIFYEQVVSDPNWNGFLFLNAPVDISEFPDELKFLIAGVDTSKFYAHHIGFSQTPFKVDANGKPDLDQTAAFGLIDYNDEADLYRNTSIQFAFKTMQLKARFANAGLVDFSTQIELMLNHLLATPLSKTTAARGNNLIINGTYQSVGGSPTYAFALTGENVFGGANSALTSFEVLSVRLITGGDTNSDIDTEVLTSFILTGNLRFINFSGDSTGDVLFDLFSFGPDETTGKDGYLRYGGLEIDMSFDTLKPTEQTFVVHETSMSFDISNSEPRDNALFQNFPLTMGSLIASPNLSSDDDPPTGLTPEDIGFTSVSAPFDQTPMVPTWYGMQFILDMGTLGALSGGQSLKITILAAWSQGVGQLGLPAYAGLQLPNIPAVGGSLPIQGVLKLGFKNFVFQNYTKEKDGVVQVCYNLRLKRFALSILVWSFPPGNFDVVLFGNPDEPQGSLGWYAAYDDGSNESDDNSGESTEVRMLEEQPKKIDRIERKQRSGRRTPPVK